MRRFLVLLLIAHAFPAVAADDADEALVKTAGLSTDGPALLDFVKQRSRATIDKDELAPFLKDLGAADPKVADAAAAALVSRGPLAVPALRRLANDLADKTRGDRARKALALADGRSGADLAASVVRTLGVKKQAGTVEALLEFLPYADDPSVLDAIGFTLTQLAYPDGKAHPELLKAVDSDQAILRATAAEALTRVDHPGNAGGRRQAAHRSGTTGAPACGPGARTR